MIKAKIIIAGALIAVISLVIIPLSNQGTSEPLVPKVRPVLAPVTIRDNTPPTESKALVGEETTEISTHSTLSAGTDFEPPNPTDATEILMENITPKDNPTTTPMLSKNTVAVTMYGPKMGDTRIVDGQKQIYFLGFGWIDDNDEPNVAIFVDGDGDINKMVGCM